MTHPTGDKEHGDQPTVPLTLDSFDPLRDAETLLDDDAPPKTGFEVDDEDPATDQEHTVSGDGDSGPEDTDEDTSRFDAG